MREIRNAIIKSTRLGYEDHGIMTAFLDTRSGACGQAFGGYGMGGRWGIEFIKAVIDTLGVDSWEKLPGTHLRIDAEPDKILRIGHIIDDRWFDPEKDLKQYMGK